MDMEYIEEKMRHGVFGFLKSTVKETAEEQELKNCVRNFIKNHQPPKNAETLDLEALNEALLYNDILERIQASATSHDIGDDRDQQILREIYKAAGAEAPEQQAAADWYAGCLLSIVREFYWEKAPDWFRVSFGLLKDLLDSRLKPRDDAPSLPECLSSTLPTTHCIERGAVIDDIKQLLEQNKHVALVHGVGGVGKTAVAAQICSDLKQAHKTVGWMTSTGDFKRDLLSLELYNELQALPENRVNAICALLREVRQPVYLFLDNVETLSSAELGIIRSFSGQVHLLITARHPVENVGCYPLDVLEEESAVHVFYEYYQKDQQRKYWDTAMEIVEAVQRHTLMIELLARAANMSWADSLPAFWQEMKEKGFYDVSTAQIKTTHSEERQLDDKTIRAQIRFLYRISGLGEDKQRVLRIFSIFPAQIPVFSKACEWAGFAEEDCYELAEKGWLTLTDDGYLMHTMIRESLKLQQQEGEVQKPTFEECKGLIDQLMKTKEYLQADLPYTEVEKRLPIPTAVAEYFYEEGVENETVAALLHNLANVTYARGGYLRALELCEKALRIREKVLGTEHPDTATTYNNMAGVYQAQGDYPRALEYDKKALRISEKVLGTEHPDTATTYNNMALVYQAQGDYPRALEYLKKALRIREKVLGTEHPDTATTYNNMAGIYRAQGDYPRALEYLKKALRIREKVLGTEHSDTATTYNNMAGVYQAQGAYPCALEYYEKALRIAEEVLGMEHPYTAGTYNNMAGVYQAQGDYPRALEYDKKALRIRKKVLGTEHPDTATTYNNIAIVYQGMGDYHRALEFYEKALPILEKSLGHDHPNTKIVRENYMLMRLFQEPELFLQELQESDDIDEQDLEFLRQILEQLGNTED